MTWIFISFHHSAHQTRSSISSKQICFSATIWSFHSCLQGSPSTPLALELHSHSGPMPASHPLPQPTMDLHHTLTLGRPMGLNKKAHCIWGTSDLLAWGFHLGTLSSFQKFMEKLSCGEGRDSQGGSKDDRVSPTVSDLDKCISSWVFSYQSGKGNIY